MVIKESAMQCNMWIIYFLNSFEGISYIRLWWAMLFDMINMFLVLVFLWHLLIRIS